MILKKLELENFRQFAGKHVVAFSGGADRKVSVVHGQNGSGKTAILNAFLWVLYERTTEKFKEPDKLTSLKALAEAKDGQEVVTTGTLHFEHNGLDFMVTRELRVRKTTGLSYERPSSKLTVVYRDASGRTHNEDGNPQVRVHQLFPPALSPYFFFDGETMEHLTDSARSQDVSEAIKLVMGITVYDRVARDLRENVRKKFIQELKKFGTDEASKLAKELEVSEATIESLDTEMKTLDSEIESAELNIGAIDEQLAAYREVKHLQDKRALLEGQARQNSSELDRNLLERSRQVSRSGYKAYLGDLVAKAEKIIAAKRKEGELPKGVKAKFIDDLFAKHECVCGTGLVEGTPPYEKLMKWKKSLGMDDIDDKIAVLSGKIAEYKQDIDQVSTDLRNNLLEAEALQRDGQKIQEQLDEIKAQIKGDSREEISKLEEKRSDYEGRKKEKTLLKGKKIRDLEREKLNRSRIKRELDSAEDKDVKAKTAKRKLQSTERLAAICEALSKYHERQVWHRIHESVQKTYKSISVKNFDVNLSKKFEFSLKVRMGEHTATVGASTGEFQLLTLCFIGSLLSYASELHSKKSKDNPLHSPFVGGVYPVVIDSPFGTLDDYYQPRIVDALGKSAPQIVFLVSGTQWREDVEARLRPLISKDYVLTYHTPKFEGEKATLTVNGSRYACVHVGDTEYEYTSIEGA